MKGLVIGAMLALSTSAFAAMAPSSRFVNDTLVRGQQILSLKSDGERLKGVCALLRQRVGYPQIGYAWLGDYNNLTREKRAVEQWYRLVPSIIVSKAIGSMRGGVNGGSFAVDPNAYDRGNGTFEVGLTVTTAKGSTYQGKVIVMAGKRGFKIIDAEYLGFSAVTYMGRDYMDFLNQEYGKDPNRSMPVTALIKMVTSESGFVQCP